MKSIIVFIIVLLAHCGLQAQTLGLQQLGSIGGELQTGNSPVLVHSMGAVAATLIEDNGLRLDQGMFLACDLVCDPVNTNIDQELYERPLIAVYPNPTSGMLHFEGQNSFIHSYQLFSPTGQLVSSGQIDQAQISMHAFPVGLYLLHVYGRDGQLSMVSKVMKR